MDGISAIQARMRLACGLLTLAGGIAGLATIIGYLGRWFWFFDLFAHFRMQYLLGLAVVAVGLLVGRWFKAAATCLVLALVNAISLSPLYLQRADTPEPAGPVIRAMLFNVNTQSGEPGLVKRAIAGEQPDLVVLEEVNEQWITALAVLKQDYPHFVVRAREDNFGIALFSKHPLTMQQVRDVGGAGLPSIVADVDLHGVSLRVIASHPLPPVGAANSRRRNEQLQALAREVPAQRPVLLLGDLNITPWSHHFQQLLDDSGLLDSGRGHGVQASWPVQARVLGIPIDHCLHSSDIVIVDRRLGPDVASDHYPLIVDFQLVGAFR